MNHENYCELVRRLCYITRKQVLNPTKTLSLMTTETLFTTATALHWTQRRAPFTSFPTLAAWRFMASYKWGYT